MHHAESPFRKVARLHSVEDRLSDQLGGPGVGRMGLHNDWIARRQGRRRVPAGHRKGQREAASRVGGEGVASEEGRSATNQ